MARFTPSAKTIVLAAGFLILFVSGGSRFAIGLTLRPMSNELGWSRSSIVAAVFLFQAISAVATFVSGRLADRVSLRALLGAGLGVSAVGIGLMGLVQAPWQALVLYGCVFAVGNGIISTTPVGVMVTRAFAGRAGLANGFATSGLSVGQLVGVAALTALLAVNGWRSVFFCVGVAGLLLLAPISLALPSKSRPAGAAAGGARGRSVTEAARTRRFWMLLAVYAICGFNDFFVSTHIVAFALDRGLGPWLAGDLLALMGLTGLVGVLAAGALGDRLGPAACAALSFFARTVIFMLICLDQSHAAVVVFALAFGATFLVTAPMTVLFVRESFGLRNLGALTGLITMIHQICGGAGAYLGAVIYDSRRSYDPAFAIMLASAAVATILCLLLGRKEQAPRPCPALRRDAA